MKGTIRLVNSFRFEQGSTPDGKGAELQRARRLVRVATDHGTGKRAWCRLTVWYSPRAFAARLMSPNSTLGLAWNLLRLQ